jgi:hypothetical protein
MPEARGPQRLCSPIITTLGPLQPINDPSLTHLCVQASKWLVNSIE